jgi:ParB family chromosome partitioning protein
MGHARALLNITDPTEQAQACEHIINNRLSVRETEALVKRLTEPQTFAVPAQHPDISEKRSEVPEIDPNVRAALEEMARALGTKVRLSLRPDGGGKLEIEYYSQDDLDRIYSVIVRQ